MSRKKIAANLVRRMPSGFMVNQGVIYWSEYRNVIRGILLDGTAYKATWRVVDFTLPLFRVPHFTSLEYSKRIDHPVEADRDVFEGPDELISEHAFSALQQDGMIEDIMAGCSPGLFLERHYLGRVEDRRPRIAFDIGCAAALCGDFGLARRGFMRAAKVTMQTAALYGPYRDHDVFLADVERALQVLGEGHQAFQDHMDDATRQAAAVRGFCQPTTIPVSNQGA